jgi:hypothetical protein
MIRVRTDHQLDLGRVFLPATPFQTTEALLSCDDIEETLSWPVNIYVGLEGEDDDFGDWSGHDCGDRNEEQLKQL